MDPAKSSVKQQSIEFENCWDVNFLVLLVVVVVVVEKDIIYITRNFQTHFHLILLGI